MRIDFALGTNPEPDRRVSRCAALPSLVLGFVISAIGIAPSSTTGGFTLLAQLPSNAAAIGDHVLIYKENFSASGGGFYNYVVDDGTFNCIPGEVQPVASPYSRAGCSQYLPWVDGHVESRSPYWIDPNHKFDSGTPYPGIGFLNIVGFVYKGGPLDLTNATMRFKMLLDPGFDLKGGHLSFWFQSSCISTPGYTCAFTFADYIIDLPIETRVTPGQWSEVTLTPQESDWKCLGAQSEQKYRYGCIPIADALANVENIGFLIIPVPIDPVGDNSVQAAIKIDDIRISRPAVEHVTWTSVTEATVNGATLTRTGGTGWTAGAISSKVIESGDGFVEFTAGESNSTRVFGLAKRDSVPGFDGIDFGVRLTAAGAVQVYELGTLRGSYGFYAGGDRLKVAIEAGVVRYRRNGVLLYSSIVAPSYPLRARAALYSSGATVGSARIAGRLAENVEWTNSVGVSISGNSMIRVAANGSAAGAASVQSIPFGDGFVDIGVDEVDKTRTVGLSRGDSNQAEADIDFGIRLQSNGPLAILENGVSRGSFGSYATGDRLRVAVESGIVQYRRNGTLLYTSASVPTYPLGVDTALSSGGARVSDVLIRGAAEQVAWTNVQNVQATPGRLQKLSGSNWDAGASSAKAITSGDGFVEFTVAETGSSRQIGLSHDDNSVDPADIDYSFAFEGTALLVIENGVLPRDSLGTYSAGDRFRVAVESGVVRYFHNGTLIYTSGVAPSFPLVVDASLYSTNTVLTDVVFGGRLGEYVAAAAPPAISIGDVTVVEGDSGGVDAVFTVTRSRPDATPTTVSYYTANGSATGGQDYVAASGTRTFAPGETSKSIIVSVSGETVEEPNETFTVVLWNAVSGTLGSGTATGTITDDDALWVQPIGAAVSGDTITKTGAAGWNAGASWATPMTSGDGFVDFGAAETNTYRIAGLTHRDTVTTFEDVDFGILLTAEGTVWVYEAGAPAGTFGTYATGDRFRVAIVGGVVRYWHNDRLLRTSTRSPEYPLRAATALYSTGATAQNAVVVTALDGALWDGQLSQPAEWTQTLRVSANSSSLTKTSGIGWDAGASSTVFILSGPGYMELTATENNTYRIAGLSKDDTNHDYSTIDFGILLTAEQQATIYESGEFRGFVGSYAAGDRFRVSVESRVVRYWKNGSLLYTSTKPPSSPLIVDTSLFTVGSTVSSVTIGGSVGDDLATWRAQVGVTATADRIVKTGTAAWDAGAASSSVIGSGDGFVEFVASETSTSRICGLGQRSAAATFEDVDFGILLTDVGTVAIYEAGIYIGAFGPYAAGDRFRVSLAGGVVRYWRNTTMLYSSVRAPGYPLRALAALFDAGATIDGIRLVRALDAAPWDAQAGEDVVWKTVVGTSTSGNSLSKTAASGWNAGAASTKVIASGDGYVEFTANAPGDRIAGLGNDDTDQDFADVDFGLLLTPEQQVLVYEAGQYAGAAGTYVPGDRFRVSVNNGVVRYWQNQQLIYTSTAPPVYPLLLDTALFSQGAALGQASIAGVLETDVSGWAATAGVSVSATSVVKQAGAGWNAGAVSKKALQSGDGFVEFVVAETTSFRVCGLTSKTSVTQYEDVGFGILLTDSGTIAIYEAGAYIGGFGPYAAGDRIRVAIAGRTVRYWRNEHLLYTSARAPSYPLRVGTSLFTQNATISGVRFVLARDVAAWDTRAAQAVEWTQVANASAAGSNLAKSGAAGWNSGAHSTMATSADGFMEFIAAESDTYRIAGLAKDDTDTDYSTVDFGILLTAEQQVTIYESGEFRGTVAYYVAGDRFRVSVESRIVRYWKNGRLLYTSTKPPGSPLAVDTSLFSSAATITGAAIAGQLSPVP